MMFLQMRFVVMQMVWVFCRIGHPHESKLLQVVSHHLDTYLAERRLVDDIETADPGKFASICHIKHVFLYLESLKA